jgi:hypothetical protein
MQTLFCISWSKPLWSFAERIQQASILEKKRAGGISLAGCSRNLFGLSQRRDAARKSLRYRNR